MLDFYIFLRYDYITTLNIRHKGVKMRKQLTREQKFQAGKKNLKEIRDFGKKLYIQPTIQMCKEVLNDTDESTEEKAKYKELEAAIREFGAANSKLLQIIDDMFGFKYG